MPDNDNLTNQNIKNNPKIMKAWAYYDWANSVYSLVITSTIFPIYYSILTTATEKSEYVAETGQWIKVPVRHMITLFGKMLFIASHSPINCNIMFEDEVYVREMN